jgi:hypothetical protein
MTKVWVIGNDDIYRQSEVKVFTEKQDAIDSIKNNDWKANPTRGMVEAELVYVEPKPQKLSPSKYICTSCGTQRLPTFDLCWQDNLFNSDKAWCEICNKDTGYERMKTNQYDVVGEQNDENIIITITLTKAQFDRLVDSHKRMWSKLTLGDECGPLNFLSDILHEAEKVCNVKK